SHFGEGGEVRVDLCHLQAPLYVRTPFGPGRVALDLGAVNLEAHRESRWFALQGRRQDLPVQGDQLLFVVGQDAEVQRFVGTAAAAAEASAEDCPRRGERRLDPHG